MLKVTHSTAELKNSCIWTNPRPVQFLTHKEQAPTHSILRIQCATNNIHRSVYMEIRTRVSIADSCIKKYWYDSKCLFRARGGFGFGIAFYKPCCGHGDLRSPHITSRKYVKQEEDEWCETSFLFLWLISHIVRVTVQAAITGGAIRGPWSSWVEERLRSQLWLRRFHGGQWSLSSAVGGFAWRRPSS